MKQFQIYYENSADFRKKAEEIKDVSLRLTSHGSVIFYITWTEESAGELSFITSAIEELFPDSYYFGNEASGNIASGEFALGINVTCYIFENEDSRTELVFVEEGGEISSLTELWEYCFAKEGLRAVELIPSMSYIETLKINGNIPNISEDILLFGGASVNYNNATYDADIIAKGHPRTKDGMAVMLYFGSSLNFSADSILGWKGLGRLMEVTGSTGKCIREIDGMPAYSVYEKYLNLTTEDKDTLVFPLIAEEDGNEFIRTPQIINSDKSMLMFADIPAGTKVRISYGDKNTILSSVYDKAKDIAQFCPQSIRAYSCAARRLFWGDGEVGKETRPLQEIAPVCGFYTGGEILRIGSKLRVLNQTLALVGIREGEKDPKKNYFPDKKAEDTSLVSRLTYFAEKIVEEEKEQRLRAEGFQSAFISQYQVMYYLDITKCKTTLLYGDEDAKKFLPIFNTDSTKTLFSNFCRYYIDAAVEEEDRDRVKAVMNEENMYRTLKEHNSISVNYKVRRNLVDPVYTEMRMIKAGETDGRLTSVILAFKLTDEELRTALEVQEKLKEDAIIIGALSQDFACVHYIELSEDREHDISTEVRGSALLHKIVPEWGKSKIFSEQVATVAEKLVYEPDRERFCEEIKREKVLEMTGSSNTYIITTRFNVEGEIMYYQIHFSPVCEDGKITGMVAGFRSVDEQMKKELEAQARLEEALKNAEVANNSKSTFLFNMSHDIRTPMNAIKGFTAMAKKYSDNKEKVNDYLDKIDISGQQLLTLINQVLEMSRIESGKIELDEKPVSIKERFESMVTVVSAQAQSKGLQFEYSLDNLTHNHVMADDTRMGQITLNVVGNAIKYTPEGGKIFFGLKETESRKEGCGTFVFTVEDTGIGMSPEFLQKLFEPFSREKNSTVSRIQGTGLGMSIVKNLTDLLGGNIEVRSTPSIGTRFDITMDFRLCGEEEIIPEKDLKVTTHSFDGMRVLLVEDNEMNREIAKDILEEYGFIVEEAEDGDIAFEKCEEIARKGDYGYYDFILMDIQMPRMNGYDATRAIRKIPSPENTHVPIIAMTANAFEEDRQNALAAGMDEHLAKPIEIRKLLDTLSKFL